MRLTVAGEIGDADDVLLVLPDALADGGGGAEDGSAGAGPNIRLEIVAILAHRRRRRRRRLPTASPTGLELSVRIDLSEWINLKAD